MIASTNNKYFINSINYGFCLEFLLLIISQSLLHLLYYINISVSGSLSCIVLFLQIFYYFINKPIFALKYLTLFFAIITNIVGVYLNENYYIYLYEIGVYSTNYNCLLPLVCVYTVLLFILEVIDFICTKRLCLPMVCRKNIYNKRLIKFVVYIGLLSSFFLFINIYNKPFFLLGVDRIGYNNDVLGGLSFVNKLIWFIPFCAYAIQLKIYRKISYLCLTMILLCAFWSGQKFGFYFLSLYLYLLVYVTSHMTILNHNLKYARQTLVYIICAFLLIFGILYMFRTVSNASGLFDEYLFQRAAQQGQVWSQVYGNCRHTHISEFSYEVSSAVHNKLDPKTNDNFGIYKMMWFITQNSKLINSKIISGSRFSCSTQASLYYYFGYNVMFFIMIIFTLIYSFFINSYINAILKKHFIDIILYITLYYQLNELFWMSGFYALISKKTILCLFALVFINLIRHIKLNNSTIKTGDNHV